MKRLNRKMHDQRGMTFIGLIFTVMIVSSMLLVGIKVVPSYIEYFQIKKVLAEMEEDRSVMGMSARRIRETLELRLDMSAVYDWKTKKIRVKRRGAVTRVDVDYDVKKPLVGNLGAYMIFHADAEIPIN